MILLERQQDDGTKFKCEQIADSKDNLFVLIAYPKDAPYALCKYVVISGTNMKTKAEVTLNKFQRDYNNNAIDATASTGGYRTRPFREDDA